MTNQDRIEESHGLWEIAIVRLAAFVEVGAGAVKIQEALAEERSTFKHWRAVSESVTLQPAADAQAGDR